MNREYENLGHGLYCKLDGSVIIVGNEDEDRIYLTRDTLVALMQFALRNHIIEENTEERG